MYLNVECYQALPAKQRVERNRGSSVVFHNPPKIVSIQNFEQQLETLTKVILGQYYYIFGVIHIHIRGQSL